MSMADNDAGEWQPLIGLETHVQLDTETKLFCSCPNAPATDPNTHTCPVCLGLPGTLPSLNEQAVRAGVKIGKALDAEIPDRSEFHRKNYFYPDLPKNFQITQYDNPLCRDGELTFTHEGDEHRIRIRRAHLEEDPGSIRHVRAGDRPLESRTTTIDNADHTLIDYNRAGRPLVEIVTDPDFRSPGEVRSFLAKLEEVLEYLDVYDVDRDGTLRVDANISLIPAEAVDREGVDDEALDTATRVEVKNIGSHSGAEDALAYEVTRQRNALRRGRELAEETRHWDESKGVTVSMRDKESEADYRYFREADLPPLEVSDWKEKIDIPELPDARRERFREEYGLNDEDARKLTRSKAAADFFETTVEEHDPSTAATWIADILLGELNYRDMTIEDIDDRLEEVTEVIRLADEDEITVKNARETVLRRVLDEGDTPETIIEQEDLGKTSSDDLEEIVRKTVDSHPEAVSDYESGQEDALNYLIGQVMQQTDGSADPEAVTEILEDRLG